MKTSPTAALVSVCVSLLVQLSAGELVCESSLPPRPSPVIAPYSLPSPHYKSPARSSQVCYVRARGNGQDDSQTLFSALKACNKGGTVYLLDPQYTIAKALDLTFLTAVDVIIAGTVGFTTDMAYWTGNSFKYAFQSSSLFWQWGGFDVNVYGGGTIDGEYLVICSLQGARYSEVTGH